MNVYTVSQEQCRKFLPLKSSLSIELQNYKDSAEKTLLWEFDWCMEHSTLDISYKSTMVLKKYLIYFLFLVVKSTRTSIL